MTLRPVKNWFNAMSPRERFMLVAFVWAAIVLWSMMLVRQIKEVRKDQKDVAFKVQLQDQNLAKKTEIETKLIGYKNMFAETYNDTELYGKAQAYAAQSGMGNPTITSQKGQTKEIFKLNTVTVHFQNTNTRSVMAFAANIVAESPRMAIDELSITGANRANPLQISGDLRINSLELKPGALDSIASNSPATPAAPSAPAATPAGSPPAAPAAASPKP